VDINENFIIIIIIIIVTLKGNFWTEDNSWGSGIVVTWMNLTKLILNFSMHFHLLVELYPMMLFSLVGFKLGPG
jgi:hypothetical protein